MNQSPDFWPPAPALQRQSLTLSFEGRTFPGEVVAPPQAAGPRPLVLVIHNYQGLKFFDVHVAEYLARVGYVGLAIDLYGDMMSEQDRLCPTDPAAVEAHFRKAFQAMVAVDHDYGRFRALLGAWLDMGKALPQVDNTVSPAAIGYCFGGVAVLEAVRGGLDLSGVVSFHGLLQTGEDPNPERLGVTRPPLRRCANVYNTRTIVQIENGAEYHLVQDDNRKRFFAEMDAAGVDWSFHDYARTPHGFALPPSLGLPGHLHEAADRRSTMNMLSLFRELFPHVPQNAVSPNAAGTSIPGG
ncbi:MAG: dienelactone hydrolase family protein [Pseudomonadales bacterium]